MNFSLARQRFYQEIHQPEDQMNLARAALYIAQEEYPDLEVEEYLNALDVMAQEVQERLPAERYPLRIIQTINHYLYSDLGFRGNNDDYYDPRNSFLNQVIDRRTGIPITLALVYLEITDRLDFPMVGIGMPGHFLIRPTVGEMDIFVDAFHQGEVMFAEDCQERLSQLYGGLVELRPEFLQPISKPYFLVRMLTNLKAIYLQQEDLPRLLAVIEKILLLIPDDVQTQRDRGILYFQMGRWTEASQDLHNYLQHQPRAEDAIVIQELLRRMKQAP